jgi:hypothetical protein
VYFPFGFMEASLIAAQAKIKLSTSLALWPASANSADELANKP